MAEKKLVLLHTDACYNIVGFWFWEEDEVESVVMNSNDISNINYFFVDEKKIQENSIRSVHTFTISSSR